VLEELMNIEITSAWRREGTTRAIALAVMLLFAIFRDDRHDRP